MSLLLVEKSPASLHCIRLIWFNWFFGFVTPTMGTSSTSNHRLAIAIGRWLIMPISRDTIVCHFSFYTTIESEAHLLWRWHIGLLCQKNILKKMRHILCWRCPLYNIIGDKYQLLLENVVLGGLESFYQLDHQPNISLYLTEAFALHHSKEFAGLTSS